MDSNLPNPISSDLPSDSDSDSDIDIDTTSETNRVPLASPEDYEGISHAHLGAIIQLVVLIAGTALFGYGFYYFTSSRRPVVQWIMYIFYAITMVRGVLQFVQKRRYWDLRMRMSREEVYEDEDGDLELGLLDDGGSDEDEEGDRF